MTKRQADQLMRLTNLASTIAIEAARSEYSEEVKQKLTLARIQVEAAASFVRVPA